MPSLKHFLANNRPSAKPEIWTQPRAAALRRLATWCHRLAEPTWYDLPTITSLHPEGQLLEVIPSDTIGKPIAFFGCYEYGRIVLSPDSSGTEVQAVTLDSLASPTPVLIKLDIGGHETHDVRTPSGIDGRSRSEAPPILGSPQLLRRQE